LVVEINTDLVLWNRNLSFITIDPMLVPVGQPTEKMTLNEFLKLKIINFNELEYSVQKYFSLVANKAGGVHLDSNPEEVLLQLDQLDSRGIPISVTILKSISLVILKAFKSFKYHLNSFERFEGKPSTSIFFSAIFLKSKNQEVSFVSDIGASLSTDRISLFIDEHDYLNIRILDSNSKKRQVRVGYRETVFRNQNPITLIIEIVESNGEKFLYIDLNDWFFSFELIDMPISHELMPLVIGSDMLGIATSNFNLFGKIISKIFSSNSQRDSLNKLLLLEKVSGGKSTTILGFRGNQFMYSSNHPNIGKFGGNGVLL